MAQSRRKQLANLIVDKISLPLIASIHHVVNGSLNLNPKFPRRLQTCSSFSLFSVESGAHQSDEALEYGSQILLQLASRIVMFCGVRSITRIFRKWLRNATEARTLLLDRRRKLPGCEDALLLVDQPGIEKMSQVILDFAQPWLTDAEAADDVDGVLGAAILAWNLSQLPEKDCELEFQEHVVPKLARQHQITLRKMITRKRTHFANNHRVIIDYQIGRKSDALDLQVITTI